MGLGSSPLGCPGVRAQTHVRNTVLFRFVHALVRSCVLAGLYIRVRLGSAQVPLPNLSKILKSAS